MDRIFYRHNAGAHEFYLEALGQAAPAGAVECPPELYGQLFGADPVTHGISGPGADGLPFLEPTGVVHPTEVQLAEAHERAWRDEQLRNATGVRDRHRDELELGLATTLSVEQFLQLLGYLQALRDWPQTEAFPDSAARPARPEWLPL